jgi:uncharacterized protein YkwD
MLHEEQNESNKFLTKHHAIFGVSNGLTTCMKTRIITLFLITCLILCDAADTNAQTISVPTNSSYTVLPGTVNRTVMLRLVNAVRKRGCQCGDAFYKPAPPLAWNSLLEEAAYKHSSDMATNKYFGHIAPDGSRGGTRIARAGYQWKTFGENIGQGYKTEKEMLDGWLASPGHCKNIMSKSYKEMGVSRVGTLWTQTFGSR